MRKPVVVEPALSRREEILTIIGCPEGVTPQGRIVGTTNDMQQCPRWDDLGLTRAEQNAKIREMLDGMRRTEPELMPVTSEWFTAGIEDLASAKHGGCPSPHPPLLPPPPGAASPHIQPYQWSLTRDNHPCLHDRQP